MRKTNRFAALLLSIMMLFSCFFFTSCADDSIHGTYHLAQIVSKDESELPSLVNLNIFTNWLSFGMYIKLVLHEDNFAELRFKVDEEPESIKRGSWSVADDGSIHLLFEDELTIAKFENGYIIWEDEFSKLTFRKLLFDYTSLTEEK